MKICNYGCGQKAKYQFKNSKWCCSKSFNSCPAMKLKNKESNKGRKPWNDGLKNCFTNETIQHMSNFRKGEKHWNYGKKWSEEVKKKIGKGNKGKVITEEQRIKQSVAMKGSKNPMFGVKRIFSKEEIEKQSKGRKLTISKIKKKYPFFSKVEKMSYNPDKPGEKEMQVHCKNHSCSNSKERGGWFIPDKWQLSDRIRALEHPEGNDGRYFYCSEECKNTCSLYYSRGNDPFKETETPYTISEYNQFREFVLERDNYKCQYCDEKAVHVHHERPQKLEPFFALDPDFAWSCCEQCHYEKGHRDECSTGKLAIKVC